MRLVASAAAALVAPGKGILAADESVATMSARLAAAGVAATQETRRAYREMLVTTPGLAGGISGVILCDETLRQHVRTGRTFPVALRERGMMAGIKVDTGARPLAGTRGETVTEGLDGLLPRLREYAELGAQFAKWRAVLRIGPGMPSSLAVRANAQALGRYAAACQDAGLVPIVEPEVLMVGAHTLGHCESVTSMVLLEVISELHDYGVDFEGVVLKPNMALPGTESGADPAPAEVADATMGMLPPLVAAHVLVRPRAGGSGAGRLAGRAGPVGRRPAGACPPGRDEHGRHVRPVPARAGAGPRLTIFNGGGYKSG
jgi:fructose-bisphosphate aldolase class I